MIHEAELEMAKRAALAAGSRLAARETTDLEVSSDAGRDVKMQADREAEKIIVEALAQGAHPVLAEESGDHGVREEAPYWVVDPLDGTFNYLRDIPHYCVSIGLWRDQRPLLGVLYDVPRAALYAGVVGEGAWRDDSRIRVSAQGAAAQAVLATGFPVGRDFAEDALRSFVADVRRFKKIRLFGSAALSMAYVADGTVDAYAEDGIKLWDVAAGAALVSAAGGAVDIERASSSTWTRNVRCAGNPSLWEGAPQ